MKKPGSESGPEPDFKYSCRLRLLCALRERADLGT